MNKLKKLGLTALAGSLVATSVNAGEMTVTGGATLTMESIGGSNSANGITMTDALVFSGSGELDNGWTVGLSMKLDSSDGSNASVIDNRSITIGMGDLGTLTFYGKAGSSAMTLMDDTTPNAYGETWDILGANTTTGAGTEVNAFGSATNTDTFLYSNSSLVDGVTVTASYVPSDGSTEVEGSTDITIKYTGIEGLELGYGKGEDNSAGGSANVDLDVMYAKYAYGPVTVGITETEKDGAVAVDGDTFNAVGITYAVSDDISIGWGEFKAKDKSVGVEQKIEAITFSYTQGGMTLSGAMVDRENLGYGTTAASDDDGYEIGLSFAF